MILCENFAWNRCHFGAHFAKACDFRIFCCKKRNIFAQVPWHFLRGRVCVKDVTLLKLIVTPKIRNVTCACDPAPTLYMTNVGAWNPKKFRPKIKFICLEAQKVYDLTKIFGFLKFLKRLFPFPLKRNLRKWTQLSEICSKTSLFWVVREFSVQIWTFLISKSMYP